MAKYEHINVQLTGNDGNGFAILGMVGKAMRDNGVPKEEIDAFRKEAMSGDYDHLLATVMDWVVVS